MSYGMNGWNKENRGDLISRAEAIAVADSSDYVGLSVDDVKKVTDEVVKGLKQLPSAQPEIIRCRDCKYCDRGIDEDGNPFLKCLGWVYGGTHEEDFCSHAERRTDG